MIKIHIMRRSGTLSNLPPSALPRTCLIELNWTSSLKVNLQIKACRLSPLNPVIVGNCRKGGFCNFLEILLWLCDQFRTSPSDLRSPFCRKHIQTHVRWSTIWSHASRSDLSYWTLNHSLGGKVNPFSRISVGASFSHGVPQTDIIRKNLHTICQSFFCPSDLWW